MLAKLLSKNINLKVNSDLPPFNHIYTLSKIFKILLYPQRLHLFDSK